MSFASMTIFILFFVNFGFFLLGSPAVNSPMLAFVKAIWTSDYNLDWHQIVNWQTGANLLIIVGIAGLVSLVSSYLTTTVSVGTNTGISTGSQFNAVNTLIVIAMAVFMYFAAVPNFSAMGFPSQLVDALNIFFGFMIVMGIWGMFRNE